jgi:hypothetical protein
VIKKSAKPGGLFISALMLLLLTANDQASAGELRLTGTPVLETYNTQEGVRIRGLIELKNEGNEPAIEVQPELELGLWNWRGEPKGRLLPQETAVWEFDEPLPEYQFKCSPEEPCSKLKLPNIGLFHVLVTRHYQDENYFQFSSPGVALVGIGEYDKAKLSRRASRRFSIESQVREQKQEFRAEISLTNLGAEPLEALLTYHTSEELLLPEKSKVISLPGHETARVAFSLHNRSALPGSAYAVFILLEWNEEGLRNQLAFPSRFKIPVDVSALRPFTNAGLIAACATALLFSLIFVAGVLFCFRKRRGQ